MNAAGVLAAFTVAALPAFQFADASAAGEQLEADPAANAIAYAKLIEEYQSGDSDRAIREISTWKPDVTLGLIREIEKARLAGSRTTAHLRPVLTAFPAAVMLHTEAGLRLNWRGDRARATLQWRDAGRLAELHPLTGPQPAFLRAWYRALGLFFLGSYEVRDARALLERGLQRFPDDIPITLALGQAYEARGTFSESGILSVRPDLSREASEDLLAAERIYRSLLARDPLLAEARLRLGRVLEIMGRSDEALSELNRVAATRSDARLTYLAHLFAGDLLRRRSRLADARREFALGVDCWPGGQAAALGLGEVLHSLGERIEAASGIASAIEDRGDSAVADPFRNYHFGDRAEQRRLLEAVKAMARDQ